MDKYRVNFYDEAPSIGCGNRIVKVVSRGWKWVIISSQGKRKRFERKEWEKIERKAKCLNSVEAP